jgi:uncharacterized protein YfiM (DUF2279 family)
VKRDKILHFAAGIATVLLGWAAHAANGQGEHVLAGLMLLGAMAAVGREAYNLHDGGRWSWADVVWTMAGVGCAGVVVAVFG